MSRACSTGPTRWSRISTRGCRPGSVYRWRAIRAGRISAITPPHLFDEFTPLAGDRAFAEDAAIVAALARFRGRAVAVIGHEKGSDTKTRLKHNFGMAMPEGYRKAQRLFALADRFGLPVISLVDTSGAYAGVAAEERGQAEAIARLLRLAWICACRSSRHYRRGRIGRALAIATANRVYMLENSVYSVISPEGCASILWRKPEKNQDAAAAMRLTAQDLLGLGDRRDRAGAGGRSPSRTGGGDAGGRRRNRARS